MYGSVFLRRALSLIFWGTISFCVLASLVAWTKFAVPPPSTEAQGAEGPRPAPAPSPGYAGSWLRADLDAAAARAHTDQIASWSVQRALLTPQANHGSLYRCRGST